MIGVNGYLFQVSRAIDYISHRIAYRLSIHLGDPCPALIDIASEDLPGGGRIRGDVVHADFRKEATRRSLNLLYGLDVVKVGAAQLVP